QTPQRMQEFVSRLFTEADLWTRNGRQTIQPRTIFFGGGTPSLLPIEQMTRLIDGLKSRFDCSQVNEWTVEVNPATASAEYCRMLRESGIDRLSFGAQSFDRNELAMLERHHDPDDVPRSIELARSAGFKRLNVDLIYAIPGQSLTSWARSLDAAISLGLSHYSCYGLTYEPNTPMAVKKRLGHFQAAADELELSMLHHARQRLSVINCPAYEISNYAADAQECQHNLLYWNGGNYVGLGPSAASHIEGHRFKNRPHLGEWEYAIDSGELPATDVEILSSQQRAGELIMLQLRLTRGVRFDQLDRFTGEDPRRLYGEQLQRLSRLGLLQVNDVGFHLSEAGINVADAIASTFLA
ncbi:MAG TPA: radical SAM family heme chaperone HemW, partial [Tepidisphaeraceae bacterium]|nr:radical SAM family heme chaperone HemW [Tepidisphaeraceae bacterium]